jgi:hypothetical protein
MKRAIVPMLPKRQSLPAFEIILYGSSAVELMTVPNERIASLARRYPSYTSSLFLVRDFHERA